MATRNFLSAPPTDRVGRYPKHTFNVDSAPFYARPFMIAPVLPAETLNSLYLESRVITAPINNPIIGWKKEYFYFYVKMSDLLDDQIKEMFIDPNNGSLPDEPEVTPNIFYHSAIGGVNWLMKGMTRIMKHYFWDENQDLEDYGAADFHYRYPTYYRDCGVFDSITDKDEMPVGDEIANATTAGDLERLQTAFEHLRAMGMANMSYEDFLRTYGITVKDPTEGKPELLWHLADWQYPSNTINPADGKPTSAVSWVFKQSMRDKKFFTEPGFVIGLTITRPKMYMGLQGSNASSWLTRAWDWMPALLAAMPETRLKNFEPEFGPLLADATTLGTDGYWLDMCDLFIHGDQFIEKPAVLDDGEWVVPNDRNLLLAPVTEELGVDDYRITPRISPSVDDVKRLFKAADLAGVKEDGFTSLAIKGKQVDLTQTAGFANGL